MILCAAQLAPERGSIERNMLKHLVLIDAAVARHADLIFFPELSLTGYEPKLAKELATDINDPRLDVLQLRADAANIVIGTGLPTHSPDGVQIAMVLFRPRGQRLTYAKQQLHADELPYFVAGNEQLIVPMDGHTYALAICYESLQASHAESAARHGADMYLASVAKPQRGVARSYEHYPEMAKKHSMAVLMANAVGACEDFVSAGRSAVWNNAGALLVSMDDQAEGFVMFDSTNREGSIVLIP